MKIETEIRDDHQMKVIAEFETAELEGFKQKAARKISKETKIPGFRPGKAPYAVVKRLVGDGAIQQEAVELLVDEKYPEVLKETGARPSHPGALDEIISLDPPKFSFLIPLLAEVNLGDYQNIRKDYSPDEVSEEEVSAFVKRLQNSYATAEPVERAAQEGDLVAVKLTGTLVHPEEGEDPEFIKERPYQVIIGNADMMADNYPYEGFASELIGLSANDEKDIQYTYPEDSAVEKLRGREMVFHVTVQTVKSMNVPELNDEFAQTLGEYENVDALLKIVRENLATQKQDEYDRKYYDELVDEIIDQATIKYSPPQLDEEIHSMLHTIEDNLARQNLDLETYLKMTQMDQETFIANEVRPSAEKRLKRSLVLDQIARDQAITLADGELQSAFNETMQELSQTTDLQKMEKQLSRQRLADAIAYEAAARAINRRVMQRLKELATGQADAAPAAETAETTEENGSDTTLASDTAEETPASEA